MGTWSTQQPSLQNFCITAWSLIWEYYLRKTYTTALLLDYEWLRWCKKKREKDPNYSKPSLVTEVTFLKNPTVKETAICKCQTLWEKQCQKNQRHNTIICKFLINKHTNICVDVCRNESCQGDQTMLGAWQSDTQKIWRGKNLTCDCFVFFCMSLYTSLCGAMRSSMSLLQPYTQGPIHF